MAPSSVDDVYANAKWLCGHLEARGQTQPADELRIAIAAGATGTEILMALRWHLQQLREAGAFSNDEVSVVDRIVSDIQRLLKF